MKIEAITTGLEAGGRALSQRDITKSEYKKLHRDQRLKSRPQQTQRPQTTRDIDAEIDDLIRALRKMSNAAVPAYVKYIRDRLDQTFGAAPAMMPTSKTQPQVQKGGPEPIFIGGQKLDPRNPKDAEIIARAQAASK